MMTNKIRHAVRVSAFLMCLIPAGLAWGQGAELGSVPSIPMGGQPYYVIQPNDVLEIFVWAEPELTREVLVRPDGRVSLPLVQDIQASGLTPPELKLNIEDALKRLIDLPNVTVIVKVIQSYQVFVTGQVETPGALMSQEPITVLQALALAGGFSEYPKKGEIVVIRNAAEDGITFDFDYDAVIDGRRLEQNILLRSGDTVVVPGG
jgi:polysaccharide export outer membrane protein